MNFVKSVLSNDREPSDLLEHQGPVHEYQENSSEREDGGGGQGPLDDEVSNPNLNSAWSIGGLIKTFASRSESLLQTYRRDLDEFRSGLKKETSAIREVASRAVKDLPVALDAGASVAQQSLESVGQAIDDIGGSVWRGTAEIISHGKDALLSSDHDSDSSDFHNNISRTTSTSTSKRYSRFDAQVLGIRADVSTYCEEPEDLDDFNRWKLGFSVEGVKEETQNLLGEDGTMERVFMKLVPSVVDQETFWCRYFYRVYKLKQVEDARANLVRKAISREEEEDLSWEVDDDDDEESNTSDFKNNLTENKELEKKDFSKSQFVSNEVVGQIKDEEFVEKMVLEGPLTVGSAELSSDDLILKSDDKLSSEGKTEHGESSKDSDVSVVSSQPSLHEEDDLGWDEIEDLGSNDEKQVTAAGGSPNKVDLLKRLSAAEEEEDLSWDIEDDEPAKS